MDVPQAREKSEYQEELMRDGWIFESLSDTELGEEYGIKPVYGLQDIFKAFGIVTLLSHKSEFYHDLHFHGQKASSPHQLSDQHHVL